MRSFRTFSYKDANYKVSSCGFNTAVTEIKKQRSALEKFIAANPVFKESLLPVDENDCLFVGSVPKIARIMKKASDLTGVGPMAAVAGSFAQQAAETVISSGCAEAIVENGGDIFLILKKELFLGLYTGETPLGDNIAFKITPETTPLAVCSSSSLMGHSLSLGKCDLATVFSASGALADAAATLACNMIKEDGDVKKTVDQIMSIEGITGIFAVKNDRVGIGGTIPELVKNNDPEIYKKVTRDLKSNFPDK